jgi:uncharacterized membrane protein
VVTWPAGKKKPKTRQLHKVAAIGAMGGAFWGMLFGILFLVPLLGMALGAARLLPACLLTSDNGILRIMNHPN